MNDLLSPVSAFVTVPIVVPSSPVANDADIVEHDASLSIAVAPNSIGVNPVTISLSLTLPIASLASLDESASSYDIPSGTLKLEDSPVEVFVIVPVVEPSSLFSNDAESVEPVG